MAKGSGGTRIVKPYSYDRQENINAYHRTMRAGGYDKDYSYLSDKTGAYALYANGHVYHKEEVEASRFIADNGINVTLTPEGAGYEMYATNVVKGKYKFSEGKVSMFTYEQKTPTEITSSNKSSVRQAIDHANSKRSQIALIYDKNGLLNRKDIEEGMKLYQSKYKNWKTKGVKAVLVLNKKGSLFEHQFEE